MGKKKLVTISEKKSIDIENKIKESEEKQVALRKEAVQASDENIKDGKERIVSRYVTKKGKKRVKKKFPRGLCYIKSTYNNTIVTITDLYGNVLTWGSAGVLGFKGARKSTPFAATKVGEFTARKAKEYGVNEVDIFVKGIAGGKESAVRAIANNNIKVNLIKDITPVPHNGCRPRKPKRN